VDLIKKADTNRPPSVMLITLSRRTATCQSVAD